MPSPLLTDTFCLYTAQMAQRFRAANMGLTVVDTTVKSGNKAFAPSWDIVMRHKAGTLDDAGYMAVYRPMMADSYRYARSHWLDLIAHPGVCIMCYCTACTKEKYVFCHRYPLVTMLERVCQANGRAFAYMGEITPGGIIQPILPGL